MSKIIFIKHLLHLLRPKIKTAQNLLKFGTFDISNIPISVLMSEIIFYEIFTSCQAKLTPKLKLLRNSCLIFKYFDLDYDI